MQSAKKAVETAKETAANIGASAKSGMEKTKATVQEKVSLFPFRSHLFLIFFTVIYLFHMSLLLLPLL